MVCELDGFAAGIDELFKQGGVIDSHRRVLCDGTQLSGALL
jgi:hypothetical protein